MNQARSFLAEFAEKNNTATLHLTEINGVPYVYVERGIIQSEKYWSYIALVSGIERSGGKVLSGHYDVFELLLRSKYTWESYNDVHCGE